MHHSLEKSSNKALFASLVQKILYTTPHTTKAMQYGHNNEQVAWQFMQETSYCHPLVSATKTGFHIDLQVKLTYLLDIDLQRCNTKLISY